VTELRLARARARLLGELSGGANGRVAARRVSGAILDKLNDPDCAPIVLLSGDDDLKAQMVLSAAAILNSNDIALSVSAEDRAALGEVIDADTRKVALQARPLARSATGAVGAACAANIKASAPEIEMAWAHISPFLDTPDVAHPDMARLTAVTEMAMSHLDFGDG